MTDAIQLAGFIWRGLATWWKPGIRMQRGTFSHSAEYLVYGSNGPSENDHYGAQQNVFKCPPTDSRTKDHIAEKPFEVMEWIISVVTRGVTVLDPFMGSGVTLLAAKHLGHPAIGIETDERYCEIAAKRLSADVFD